MAVRSTRTDVHFGVLGPLLVQVSGREVNLSGVKERGLLAFLLLRANETVPPERLIDALWPGDPPATARNSLQVRLSHLRKLLGAERIETRHGYRLAVTSNDLDLLRFRELVVEARSHRDELQPARAAENLAEALALWRGEVLPEFSENPSFRTEVARLADEHLAAFEARVDAELDLGQTGELVPELEAAVAANPLREQLMWQLMVALYRAGRQVDALDAYALARRQLVDELGLEPSPLLSDLHQRILNQDPALSTPRPVPVRTAGPPSRRNLTIVLAVLDAPEGIDPEAAGRMLEDARSRAGAIFEDHNAVSSAVAGGLVGAFGLPVAREDDPLRAIRAASELSRDDQLKVAVETGVALASDLALADDRLVAALTRLAETVSPGRVVLGPGARAAVADAVEVADSVLVSFDPAAEPIPRHFDAPLIGRVREFERLRESLRWAIRNSSGHLVTVLGPAGIGKSRLARELCATVPDEAIILNGRCLAYGSGAFWPLAEMVKQAAGDTTPEALLDLLGNLPDRRSVVDQLAAALGTGTGMRAEDAFWAFRKLFMALAADQPLVLLFEDLHWAEGRLLDFIEELVERAEATPILVVCLARPDLFERRPSWGGGKLDAESIQLSPLSNESSDELIRILGESIPEAARTQIAARAEGNPLFIEQLVALAVDDPQASPDAIPPSIHAVLAARIDRLDSEERVFVERASIIGLEFSLSGAAALSSPPRSESEMSAIAGRLVRKELLRPTGPEVRGDQQYRFGHILIRDVAYGSVLKATRAELHERFARRLERGLADHSAEIEEIIGYHLERSYELQRELKLLGPELDELANEGGKWLAAAGSREIDRSNLVRGADLLRRALALMTGETRERGVALRQLAYVSRLKGRWNESREYLDRALACAEAVGDEALRASLEDSGLQLRLHTDPAFTLEEFVSASANLLAGMKSLGSPRDINRVKRVLAWAYAILGQHQVAIDLIEGAYRTEHVGETRKLLPSLWLGGPFPVEKAVAECQDLLEEGPPPRTTASCYRTLAVLRAMEGRFDAARRFCALDQSILEELAVPVIREQATAIRGTVELLAGKPAVAERALRRAIGELDRLGYQRNVSGLSAQLARALMDQGRDDEARRVLESLRESPTSDVAHLVDVLGVRARLLTGARLEDEAERLGREAISAADATDSPDLQACARVDLAKVLIGRGDAGEAKGVLATALELFERKGNLVEAARTKELLTV